MRSSAVRSSTMATGRSMPPARWSTTSSTPRRGGAYVRATSSTSIRCSSSQRLVSVTNRSNAAAPLTRPRIGWCSSGTPANDSTIAARSPVLRPSKNRTVGTRSSSRSRMCTVTGAVNSSGAHGISRAPVPAVEARVVARVPGLPQSGRAQVPVGSDLAGDVAQVVPEVVEGGAPPEPVAVVYAMDDEAGPEHDGVGNHRVVVRVGVLLDVEVLLDDAPGVGEEGPLGADRVAELLEGVVLVGRDRGDLRVRDVDLRKVRGELEVLLVLLGAVVAAREREDHRVVALDLAELARQVLVVGQFVVRERGAGCDVRAHGLSLGRGRAGAPSAPRRRSRRRWGTAG